MTVPLLQQMIREFEIPVGRRMPSLEMDLVKTGVQYFWPAMSLSELAEVTGIRSYKSKVKFTSILGQTNVDALVAELTAGGDDVEAISNSANEYAKHVEMLKKKTEDRRAGKGGGKGGGGAAKRKVQEHELERTDLAQKHLPKLVGCKLSLEHVWNFCFRVDYPTPLSPHSQRFPYEAGNRASCQAAMKKCLRWAWAQHMELTSHICPWDL